uniref:Methyltransferase type 11 domain-containing protein n=1 Tax=Kalanchoe fedtschenkoi TaxID=63787 RepID=A0A7N0V6D9_KALFE
MFTLRSSSPASFPPPSGNPSRSSKNSRVNRDKLHPISLSVSAPLRSERSGTEAEVSARGSNVCICGRRHLIGAAATSFIPSRPSCASDYEISIYGELIQLLAEVRRVLRPGGLYLFVEHVAAKDGSFLRVIQTLLDPLQQALADGCHLTRNTGQSISQAGFLHVDINSIFVGSASLLGPHVYGIARK